MKSALALGCALVVALVACTAPPENTESAQPTDPPVAHAAPAAAPTANPASGQPVSGRPVAAVAKSSPDSSRAPVASASASLVSSRDRDAVATPGPSETASVQNSAEPAATPTAIPYVAADAPPEILSFSISATTVHPGDVLSGSVTASSNVASVEVRVAGYSYNMVKSAPGIFALAVTVPNVPRMFRRTYPLVAIARNTRGDATQRTTQITIR